MNPTTAYRRARRALWICVLVAVADAGAISLVLRAPAGPATGLAVAVLGTVLAGVLTLAARLLLALTGRLRPRQLVAPHRGTQRVRRDS